MKLDQPVTKTYDSLLLTKIELLQTAPGTARRLYVECLPYNSDTLQVMPGAEMAKIRHAVEDITVLAEQDEELKQTLDSLESQIERLLIAYGKLA